MEKQDHSIILEEERCIGCTDCIKRCPTEAIRVRDGKAYIISERCIDCGNCIRVCQHKAKRATTDPLSSIDKFKIKIAIPAPTLLAQFDNVLDANIILTGLKKLGFDDIFEVGAAAEKVSDFVKEYLEKTDIEKPLINSACPAINRLIVIRYPSLVDRIIPANSPMEIAAMSAKKIYMDKGFKHEEIGVFFISPCAAKAREVRQPLGIERSEVDGIIAIAHIYKKLLMQIKRIKEPEILSIAHKRGVDWASSGGECRSLKTDNVIAVDGVENVIEVLEELENGQLDSVDYIEALACIGGCLGGPLTVTNTFIAKNNLTKITKKINGYTDEQKRFIDFPSDSAKIKFDLPFPKWDEQVSREERIKRISLMERQGDIYCTLPHIDCGSCGAPNCQALAEDIVHGRANVEDCIFMLRDRVRVLAESMVGLAEKLPPSIKQNDK